MCAPMNGNTAIVCFNLVHEYYEVWVWQEILLETYDYKRALDTARQFGYVIDVTHVTIK
jgi:hypothetical protein